MLPPIADTWSLRDDILPQPQIFHPMMTALMNAATNDSINFSTLVASLKLGRSTEPPTRPPTVKNLQTPGTEDGCITTPARFVEDARFLALATTLNTLGGPSSGALHDMLRQHNPDLHLKEEDTQRLLLIIESFLENSKSGSSSVSECLEAMAAGGNDLKVETRIPSEETWNFEYTWNNFVITLARNLKSFRVTARLRELL